jgi:hypothetical protein
MRTNIFVILLLSLCSQVSYATQVTFNFEGEITLQHGTDSDLHTLLPLGQTFTGSVTFDPATPGTPNQGSSNDLNYEGAISIFTVSFGALYATLDNGNFALVNDRLSGPEYPESDLFDYYIIQGRTDHSAIPTNVDTNIVLSDYVSPTINSGWHLRWLRLHIYDYSGGMLDDALLTSVPPDITGLNMVFQFDFQLDCCTGKTYVQGQINSISYAGSDEDGDADYINDDVDNCPTVPNPDQFNTDEALIGGDSDGDACDDDDDADGICDQNIDVEAVCIAGPALGDNCRTIPNNNQDDDDADGCGTACQINGCLGIHCFE